MNILKYIYHHTWLGKVLIYIYYTSKNHLIPEKTFEKISYKKVFGVYPNLKNPKSLNEKIKWLKLNDRTPLHTQCADKYAVRAYVSEKIGNEYLVPLMFHTTNPKEINPESLPDIPFIIKTNHDSGSVFIVFDKLNTDWTSLQKELKKRLKDNYYWRSKEWQYKNIEPRIIVEKLLLDKKGKIPFDYKVHCFNGKVNMIQVDMGRGTENHTRNWYSPDWKREPYKWTILRNGKEIGSTDKEIDKPKNLEHMIQLSESLSEPFIYVRVDWYDLEGHLYFGELTFHHDGGNRPIEPKEWDYKLGKKLILNRG